MDPPPQKYYTSGQRTAGESFQLIEECVQPSGVPSALEAISFRGPIHKPFHVFAVFPGKMKKLAGRQIRGFLPEERLKPPADVRTFPRPESIAPSCIPVVLHRLEHFLRHGRMAQLSSSRLASSRRSGKMFVNEHPARAALLPNPGIPQLHLRSLTVFFRFFHQMHGHCHPCDRPAAVHSQILACSQFDLRRALQEFLLHALVVFLPTVIRKGRHIIKYKSIFLGVELRWSIRVSSAPGRAIAIDELAKCGIVRGLLLRPRANKCQQRANDRQPHIHQPPPSLSMITCSTAHGNRSRHSISPGNLEQDSSGGGPKACRLPYCELAHFASSLIRPARIDRFSAAYCPSATSHSPGTS